MRRSQLLLLLAGVACLVSVGIGLRGRKQARDVADGDVPPVHLTVLNGSGRPGLARRIARALPAAGIVVDRTGNAPHFHFRHSLLLVNDLPDGRGAALARRLGGIVVLPEADPERSEDAVLVLGRDAGRIERALGLGGGAPPAQAGE